MRARSFLNTFVSVCAGFIAGVVAVQTVAPDLLETLTRSSLPDAVTARLVSAGDFRDIDTVFRSTGRAQLLDGGEIKILRFTEFAVTNGPNLEVWLSTDAEIAFPEDILIQNVVSLGPLKQTAGDQVYLLPAGLDPREYKTVMIWEAQFGSLYGVVEMAGL